MSLPQSTCTLIVGAGPTGLAVALSLVHQGFRDFVIVDALAKGENNSRALVVHAATLEALDTIGCGDELVSKGTKLSSMRLGDRTGVLLTPQFDYLKPYTRHPYGLILPQTFTEHILEEKLASLGVTVHRPYRVVGVKSNSDDMKLADVTFEDGQVITAKYIVGADGARSTIRTIAGINFVNPKSWLGDNSTTLEQLAQADVTFDAGNVDEFGFRGVMSPNSLFLCVPLPSTFNDFLAHETGQTIDRRIYRIICGVPIEEGPVPHSPSKEYLQTLTDKFGPLGLSSDPSVNPSGKSVCIKDVIWTSRFRTHSSAADTFFTRLPTSDPSGVQGAAILLVGDAAHIHSPAGGQGMNLGLRDAIFLGETLVKHIKSAETNPLSEADNILTAFAAVRRSHALEVIAFTKGILSLVGMKDENVAWWLPINRITLRDWLMWMLGKIPFVQRQAVWGMSGLGRR
ncbi:hypothetical protein V8B97DRAFT_1867376 [Scleroderma yunnanense]